MALATDAHGDMLDQLLEHGRPILCEKPIALTIADTQRICDAVEKSGAPMQIGFQRRFDAGMARARCRLQLQLHARAINARTKRSAPTTPRHP